MSEKLAGRIFSKSCCGSGCSWFLTETSAQSPAGEACLRPGGRCGHHAVLRPSTPGLGLVKQQNNRLQSQFVVMGAERLLGKGGCFSDARWWGQRRGWRAAAGEPAPRSSSPLRGATSQPGPGLVVASVPPAWLGCNMHLFAFLNPCIEGEKKML